MASITVQDVINDYIELGIAKKYCYDKEKIVKGLMDILANHGLKMKISVPQSQSFKDIRYHYTNIVKQLNQNTKYNRPPANGMTDTSITIFYSKEKYSDLCIDDYEVTR